MLVDIVERIEVYRSNTRIGRFFFVAQEFSLEDLTRYLDLFEELELDIWIDGG